MRMDSQLGRRVFQNSLVIATALVTCVALQADNEVDKAKSDKAHTEHANKGGAMSAEKFIQSAQASGQMELQMGQLGQQQAQNPEVKSLAAAMVRDHSQANQRLQQLASTKNISATHQGADHQKHQQHLDKLKNQSGAEFDKEFVRMALKHHKKDIQAFERAQNQINDQELKSFISETLPKLRQHQQLAQAAARSVGVDEASVAADVDADDDASAAGAAAGAVSGSREGQGRSLDPSDRPRSALDGASGTDASGTINQNDPSFKAEGQIGDKELSVDANADTDAAARVDADADVAGDRDNKVFEKGDGKVLGLSTDKNDGKFLGIIPNPRADNDKDGEKKVEVEADVDTDANDAAVGGPAKVETGDSKKDY